METFFSFRLTKSGKFPHPPETTAKIIRTSGYETAQKNREETFFFTSIGPFSVFEPNWKRMKINFEA